MAIYFPEVEDIYFPKTREYFQEVVSSYSIGNYRSATVMLYSVAVCDMLFKLQELKDMYNDTIAAEILAEVDKSRNEHDNKSKSRWEKEFIDNVYNKTRLLDSEAYTNLIHLYDHRNFSAHPAINENYELIAPTKETTIANIKNILIDILVKPPIFVKNIINTLTEDLKGKNEVYRDSYNELSTYLNNKYFSRMPDYMKLATLKAFWKFCFCLPDNEECMDNLAINRKALEILIENYLQDTIKYIKVNNQVFSVAFDEHCIVNLIVLLSKYPLIYPELNVDVRLQVDDEIEKEATVKYVSWFKYSSTDEHLTYLKSFSDIQVSPNAIKRMIAHYSDIGEMRKLIDYFIWCYGESYSYDCADMRFEHMIEPVLEKMSISQFEELINVSNVNRQIWGRGAAYSANNKIMNFAKDILSDTFDYSAYEHFRFDDKIIHPDVDNEAETETTEINFLI